MGCSGTMEVKEETVHFPICPIVISKKPFIQVGFKVLEIFLLALLPAPPQLLPAPSQDM